MNDEKSPNDKTSFELCIIGSEVTTSDSVRNVKKNVFYFFFFFFSHCPFMTLRKTDRKSIHNSNNSFESD